MTYTHHYRSLLILTAVLFLAAGCGKHTGSSSQAPGTSGSQRQAAASTQETSLADQEEEGQSLTCRDEQGIKKSEHNRAACYHLQPGTTITKVVKQHVPEKHAKNTHASKKGAKAATKTHTKVVRTTRCQPQCLIYARCRTGITTCKLGDTSPVQWFACAAKNKAASSLPHAGSAMIVATHSGHRIHTGHAVYVEEAKKRGDGLWQLRLSHTNYDRKCHLDQDAKALFDPQRMTVTFETGQWMRWAKDLKVLGFILR